MFICMFDEDGILSGLNEWHFTVDVFKYYKCGNLNGGPNRSDACFPHTFFAYGRTLEHGSMLTAWPKTS